MIGEWTACHNRLVYSITEGGAYGGRLAAIEFRGAAL
jgi:hypothetical protein